MQSYRAEEVLPRKKKRGRPPKANKNDTPSIERRRRQLREAQRAYRQRQDNSAGELRQRVTALSGTIRKLQAAFTEYVAQSQECPMTESQTALLRAAAAKIDAIFNTKGPFTETEEMSEVHELVKQKDYDRIDQIKGKRARLIGEHVPAWMDKTVASAKPRQYPSTYLGNGYSISDEPVTSFVKKVGTNSTTLWNPNTSSIDAVARDYDQFVDLNSAVPRFSIPMTIVDTTFGRRLHRAILVAGYRLLLNHKQYPLTASRVFKIPLMFRSLEGLTARFQKFLSLGMFDDLELPDRPLIYIGGAGTHYPKRDAFGIPRPRRKAAGTRAIFGAEAFDTFDPTRLNESVEGAEGINVVLAGYEGEWLDPYDVEGYLLEKNIGLDIGSSLLECEAVDQGSLGLTPIAAAPKPFDEEQIQALWRAGVDPTIETSRMKISGIGTGSCIDYASTDVNDRRLDNISPRNQQNEAQSEARTVFLDVDKLVQSE